MKNMKFDYVISNPPYAIGNAITKSVIDNVNFDNFINLMPLSCYKAKELYKNVKSLVIVDPSAFEDAAITDNLCICEIKKNNNTEKTYEDLALLTYKEEYREFYRLNGKCVRRSFNVLGMGQNIDKLKAYDESLLFYSTTRTCLDGVHKDKNAKDILFNINKTLHLDDLTKVTISAGVFSNSVAGGFLSHLSHNSYNNFCTFWYNNPLMNALIKGLNSTSGAFWAAIPNIDYSIDRDYENLTLDDIMKILKEENTDATE